jgi:MoxR-like ATPase
LIRAEAIPDIQRQVQAIACSPPLFDYVQTLVSATRHTAEFEHGLSPRSGLALVAAARAWAFVHGRTFVLPEDVQAVFPSIACHRLHLVGSGRPARPEQISALIGATPIP